MADQLTGFAAKVAREQAAAQDKPVPLPYVPQAPAAGEAAWSLNQSGTPVLTGVPEDFGAWQEASVLAASQLTAEEIAEFRALRADKKARDEQAAREAAEAAARLSQPTHHVHLADGTRLEGFQIATHYDMGNGPVPVMAAHEMSPALA